MITWNIYIVEDYPNQRDNYERLINSAPNFNVIGCFSSPTKLQKALENRKPDGILMDIYYNEDGDDLKNPFLPEYADGLRSGISIKEKYSNEIGVLFTSYSLSKEAVKTILELGSSEFGGIGFIQKNNDNDTILFALSEVCKGNRFLDYRTCKSLIPLPNQHIEFIDILSKDERKYLKMLGNGLMPKDIAIEENVAPTTVTNKFANIKKKLLRYNIKICNQDKPKPFHLVHLALSSGLSEIQHPRLVDNEDYE